MQYAGKMYIAISAETLARLGDENRAEDRRLGFGRNF